MGLDYGKAMTALDYLNGLEDMLFLGSKVRYTSLIPKPVAATDCPEIAIVSAFIDVSVDDASWDAHLDSLARCTQADGGWVYVMDKKYFKNRPGSRFFFADHDVPYICSQEVSVDALEAARKLLGNDFR
jgi:hypothetical protein